MSRILVPLCLALLPLAAAAEGRFDANDVDFLNLMGNREGYRGFGTVSDFATSLPDEDLHRMTIDEVIAYQDRIIAEGAQSSAMGRYQIIRDTLAGLIARHGISRGLIFDEEVQTYLARTLMRDCGFYDPEHPVDELGNCLAGQWAALPVLSGPGAGRSRYAGDGLNAHAVDAAEFRAVLDSRFIW